LSSHVETQRAVTGNENLQTERPDDRQATRRASMEETIMAMTWMETFRLLGVDMLAALLLVVLVFDGVEHVVHTRPWSRRKPR
jgi:hypothetical protein